MPQLQGSLALERTRAVHGSPAAGVRWAAAAFLILLAVSAIAALPQRESRSQAPSTALPAGSPRSAPPATMKRRAANAYANLPLAFIPNAGQTDERVRYHAQGPGYSVYFTSHEAVLALQEGHRGHALHLRFLGANPNAEIAAVDRGGGRVNYLTGSEHHTDLPTYERLTYRELWPGIDMVFEGKRGRLIYEFRLRPGANVSDIRLAYAGADDVSLGAGGALLIDTPLGTLRDAAPQSFQRLDGRRVPVDSRYALARRSYGFAVGDHDRGKPLLIDPSLSYSTYLGGSSRDFGTGIAVDATGAAYVTGGTSAPDFPTTAGAFDSSANGSDAFVTKLDPAGSGLAYSTYLGGSSGGTGIAVDSAGAAYVTGQTNSREFPTTAGAFDTNFSGTFDAFVTKLNPDGSGLAYSTFLGGSSLSPIAPEAGAGIAVDPAGAAYVTGHTNSGDFPTTAGAFDTSLTGDGDAFVTKLDPAGSGLAYSTYLGGSSFDDGAGIAVDSEGAAYVTGHPSPTDFPTTTGAFDTSFNGGGDAFVAKLNRAGSGLAYSTYLGGSSPDFEQGITVDSAGAAYVTGGTPSMDFPTTAGAFDTSFNGPFDAFVTKLDPAGSGLAYSTYLGGSSADFGTGISVDSAGGAYVTGDSDSTDFPTTAGVFDTSFNGGRDAFVTKLNPAGSDLAHSTYLGGSSVDVGASVAVDSTGAAYVTGQTVSTDFPTTAGAFDPSFNGGGDAFVTKLPVLRQVPCSVTQGGRITAANEDRATFGGSARSDAAGDVEGKERYRDHGPAHPQNVKSIRIVALTCNQAGTQATISGEATINGSGVHAFTINVQDLGEPGRRGDTYRILLDTGYDSGEHTLEGGNVQIQTP